MFSTEAANRVRHDTETQCRNKSERDRAITPLARDVTQFLAGIVDFGDNMLYAPEQGLARACQAHTSTISLEKCDPINVLEARDAAAEGRLETAAVAGGALDIAVSNLVAMTTAHAKNVPFVIVGPGALYLSGDPTTLMMVPKGSTIQSARELGGKTIGCNGINGIPEYCTRAWVEQAGGNSSTMKFVETNFATMMDALGASRVDAACVTEPYITEAKTTARAIGQPFDACAPRFLMSVYIATREWATANRGYCQAIPIRQPACRRVGEQEPR